MKKRFEYKIFKVPTKKWYGLYDEEEMVKQLNKLGADGWEVVQAITSSGIYFHKVILKREI